MKSNAIIGAVQSVTKTWTKQRKREEREKSARLNRHYVMTRHHHVSIKDAAWDVMEQAYLKASGGGRLPAHARQIMYAARPHIQRTAARDLSKTFDQYFTQQLLPEYMQMYPEEAAGWNVVFDARGHFQEPHTEREIPLGTLQVRRYLADVARHSVGASDFDIREARYPTVGPKDRYGAILFIEKEGFMPLFDEVKLAERYDLAIMSTKGMSVTASRQLVESLCADHNIPLLVLHDFDKAGFSIAGTLRRDTRRYSFRRQINVIDIGLRLGDIDGLETEQVYTQSAWMARQNLRENGASAGEIEFLLDRRVELNAFASDEFVIWIENKLKEHGVSKIIPDEDCLVAAYRRARRQAVVQRLIDKLLEDNESDDAPTPPADLKERIAAALSENSALTWDGIVQDIAEDDAEVAYGGRS